MTNITEVKIHDPKKSIPFKPNQKSIFTWANSGLLAYTLNNNHISLFHCEQPTFIFNYNLDTIRRTGVLETVKPNLFLYDGRESTESSILVDQIRNENLETGSQNAKKMKMSGQSASQTKSELITSLEFRRSGLIDILLVGTSLSNVYLLQPRNGSISYLQLIDKQNFSSNHICKNDLSKKCFIPTNTFKKSFNKVSDLSNDELANYQKSEIIALKFIDTQERFSFEKEPEDIYENDSEAPKNKDYQINYDNTIDAYQRSDTFHPLNFAYGSRFGYVAVTKNGDVFLKSFSYDENCVSQPLITHASLAPGDANLPSLDLKLKSADISFSNRGQVCLGAFTENSPEIKFWIIHFNTKRPLDMNCDFDFNLPLYAMLYHVELVIEKYSSIHLGQTEKIKLFKYNNLFTPESCIVVSEDNILRSFRVGKNPGWSEVNKTAVVTKNKETGQETLSKETIIDIQIPVHSVPYKKMFDMIKGPLGTTIIAIIFTRPGYCQNRP